MNKDYLFSLESVRNFDFARDMPNGANRNQFIYDNVVVIDIEYYSTEYTEISEEPKMGWEDRRAGWTLALISWHELA